MTNQHKKTLYHYPFAYYFAIEKGTFPLSGPPTATSCDGFPQALILIQKINVKGS